MSKQEIITEEYDRLRKARNERTLSAEFNRMTNEELYNYLCKKWEDVLEGVA